MSEHCHGRYPNPRKISGGQQYVGKFGNFTFGDSKSDSRPCE